MTRRSAMNDRYRKDAKLGSTRKSASSLKPKRDVGETGGSRAKKPKKGQASTSKWTGLPSTPEIKKWRKIWWILIAVGLGAACTIFIPEVRENRTLQTIAFVIELAALGPAVYIDFRIIRNLRKEAVAAGKGKSKKGSA